MHLSNTSFAELTSLSKHQLHPNNYTEKFICAHSIFANYLLAAESFPFFLFLSELHTHALWPIRMCTLKRNLNTSWPEPTYIRGELQFTQLNSFPNSIFKGRMQFQGLMADKVNVHMGETKGAAIAADDSSADPFPYIPVLKWFSSKPWHAQPCSPGSTGLQESQEGQWGVGRKQVGEGTGSQWLEDRGANERKELLGRGSGHRKHPFVHSWNKKRDKEQDQRDVKRQGLSAVYSLWSWSCSEDNPKMTDSWLSLKSHHHLMASLHSNCPPFQGDQLAPHCQNLSEDQFKNKVCSFFFVLFFHENSCSHLWLKLGAEQMSRQKKGFIRSILFKTCWTSTFWAVLDQTILILLSWTVRAFRHAGQSKYLIVVNLSRMGI